MIDAMITSAILLRMVAIVTRLLQRRTASLRHVLWSFAIVGAVTIPVLSRLAPFHLAVLPQSNATASHATPSASSRHDAKVSAAPSPSDAEADAAAGRDVSSPPYLTPAGTAATSITRTIAWMTALAIVLAMVALILLAPLVVGLTILQRLANPPPHTL